MSSGTDPSRPGGDTQALVAASLRGRPQLRRVPVRTWCGVALLAVIVFCCTCAPWLTSYMPQSTAPGHEMLPIGSPHHPLGTDQVGRDELSRVLYGGRISLLVGIAAATLATVVGTGVGIGWAFLRGPASSAVSAVVDALLSLPLLVVVLGIQAVVHPGVGSVVVAIGVTSWMPVARVARAQTATLRVLPYVSAARGLGARRRHLLVDHLLPGVAPPVLAISMFEVANAILTESTLSFLGLGVPRHHPTWGNLLTRSQDNLLGGQWWLVVLPAAGVVLTVLAVNLLVTPRARRDARTSAQPGTRAGVSSAASPAGAGAPQNVGES